MLDSGVEAGMWLTCTNKSYDFAYTLEAHGVKGRFHHLTFALDSREEILRAADIFLENGVFIETGPHKHAMQQTFFLYVYEPGGNRVEVANAGARLVLAPDWKPIVWTEAERKKGQAWGLKTIESFHTHGTPPLPERASEAWSQRCTSTSKTALVVSAHSADFVWRAGGAIALHAAAGDAVTVVCLSYGERGESAKLWRQEGMTLERVKSERRKEAEAAAEKLGVADIQFWDLGDYPLNLGAGRAVPPRRRLSRDPSRPSCSRTPNEDIYNHDHPATTDFAQHARIIAQAHGHNPGQKVLGAPPVFLFEPHQPEQCDWKPDVLLDISPVWEKKRAAIECMAGQEHLWEYYTRVALQRGAQAARNSDKKSHTARATRPCSRMWWRAWHERRHHGDSARPRRKSSRGLRDLRRRHRARGAGPHRPDAAHMRPIYAGARRSAPRSRCRSAPADNWMLHVAVEQCQAGDVLVVAPTSPCDAGYFGELLATSLASARRSWGWSSKPGCRDVADAGARCVPGVVEGDLGAGHGQGDAGSVNVPLVCAGQLVHPGDLSSPTMTASSSCRVSGRCGASGQPGARGEGSRGARAAGGRANSGSTFTGCGTSWRVPV